MKRFFSIFIVLFILSLSIFSITYAQTSDNIYDKIEYLNVINILDTNRQDVYFNEIRKNLENSIKKRLGEQSFNVEAFLKETGQRTLDISCVSGIIKNIEQKAKIDSINSNISSEKYNEIMSKIRNSRISRVSQRLLCHECIKNNGCALCNFITSTMNGDDNGFIAPADIKNCFKASQEAIKADNYEELKRTFADCETRMDSVISGMPSNVLCNPAECNKCAKIYLLFYRKFLFVKWYMELEKGYFLIHNAKNPDEAIKHFKNLITSYDPGPDRSSVNAVRGKLSLEKQKEDCQQALKYLMSVNSHYFIGCAYMLKKEYETAYAELAKSVSMSKNCPKYIEAITNMEEDTTFKDKNSIFFTFPRSGLFSAFIDNAPNSTYPYGKDFHIFVSSLYYCGCMAQTVGKLNEAWSCFVECINCWTLSQGDYPHSPQYKPYSNEFVDDANKRKAEIESAMATARLEFSGKQYPETEPVYVNLNDVFEGTIGISNYPESLAEVKVTLECETKAEDLDQNKVFFDMNGISDRRYLTEDGKKKSFGFYDGKEYKLKIEVVLTRQNPKTVFNFRCTSYCSDTFNIKATCKVNGVDISAAKKLQVWRQYTINLYAMNDKAIFPKINEVVADKLNKICIEIIYNNYQIKTLPSHETIKLSRLQFDVCDPIYIDNWLEEIKNNGVSLKRSNNFINLIGTNTMRYTQDDDIHGFTRNFYNKKNLNLIIIQYRTIRRYSMVDEYTTFNDLYEDVCLLHEIGHAFGLKHPQDDPNEKGFYNHKDNCCMYSYEAKKAKLEYCDNCKKLMKNNYNFIKAKNYNNNASDEDDEN